MSNTFVLKLLLSFLIGGSWTVFATVVVDKFGSKKGGFITGLPSTGLFGLLFIAWTQNVENAVTATNVIPITVAIQTLFVVIYIFLIKKSFLLAITTSLLTWFVLASLVFFFEFNNFNISIVIYLLTLIISGLIIEKTFKIDSVVSGREIKYTLKILLFRGLLSGSIIAFIVFVSKIVNPTLGGIFSCFPAMFLSIILLTYFSRGAEFSAAIMKSAIFTLSSLVLYSAMVRFTYIPLGMVWGTLISVLVSFSYGYLIYRFFISKLQ